MRLVIAQGKLGKQIEMYHIRMIEHIGSGSQGSVYRAYHKLLNKEVAVKMLKRPHIATYEISTLKYINRQSPYIVDYYEYYLHENGQHWVVMEHVEGIKGDHIVDLIEKGVYPGEKEVAKIIHHIAQALAVLHRNEIIYGDIKPSNFIYAYPKHAKLIDFGCSRVGPNLSTPVGTPTYFAPEKFDWNFSYPSDVWALGIMMYILICGVHPFVHQYKWIKDRSLLEHEIRHTELAFVHPRWDAISPLAKDLLQGMLTRDPQKRLRIEDVVVHLWFKKMYDNS